jgi:hypothetical protein
MLSDLSVARGRVHILGWHAVMDGPVNLLAW